MKIIPFRISNMLQKYEQQLLATRRLKRYRQSIKLIHEKSLNLYGPIKRETLVKLVAKEFFKNFLISGYSYSSFVVQDVQKELIESFDNKIFFQYPPEGTEIDILVKTHNGWKEVTSKLCFDILGLALKKFLTKVHNTML